MKGSEGKTVFNGKVVEADVSGEDETDRDVAEKINDGEFGDEPDAGSEAVDVTSDEANGSEIERFLRTRLQQIQPGHLLFLIDPFLVSEVEGMARDEAGRQHHRQELRSFDRSRHVKSDVAEVNRPNWVRLHEDQDEPFDSVRHKKCHQDKTVNNGPFSSGAVPSREKSEPANHVFDVQCLSFDVEATDVRRQQTKAC